MGQPQKALRGGHASVVLGAIVSFFEPFGGHLSPQVDQIFQKRLLIEGSKGLARGSDRLGPVQCKSCHVYPQIVWPLYPLSSLQRFGPLILSPRCSMLASLQAEVIGQEANGWGLCSAISSRSHWEDRTLGCLVPCLEFRG